MRKSELIKMNKELAVQNRRLINENKDLLEKLGLKTLQLREIKKIFKTQIENLYYRLSDPIIYLRNGKELHINILSDSQLEYLEELSHKKHY